MQEPVVSKLLGGLAGLIRKSNGAAPGCCIKTAMAGAYETCFPGL